jgi:OmpA-OmpF porin, OOP family
LKTFLFLLFILFGISEIGLTQNLVKNPSFEDFNTCPVAGGFDNVIDWYDLHSFSYYFNSCALPGPGVGVPVNLWGYQQAHTGNAYASIVAFYMEYAADLKGYIEGQFTKPLIKILFIVLVTMRTL